MKVNGVINRIKVIVFSTRNKIDPKASKYYQLSSILDILVCYHLKIFS